MVLCDEVCGFEFSGLCVCLDCCLCLRYVAVSLFTFVLVWPFVCLDLPLCLSFTWWVFRWVVSNVVIVLRLFCAFYFEL